MCLSGLSGPPATSHPRPESPTKSSRSPRRQRRQCHARREALAGESHGERGVCARACDGVRFEELSSHHSFAMYQPLFVCCGN
eukprot:3347695-Prymnesium_polylepis.1